jgi:hypothetical protein
MLIAPQATAEALADCLAGARSTPGLYTALAGPGWHLGLDAATAAAAYASVELAARNLAASAAGLRRAPRQAVPRSGS